MLRNFKILTCGLALATASCFSSSPDATSLMWSPCWGIEAIYPRDGDTAVGTRPAIQVRVPGLADMSGVTGTGATCPDVKLSDAQGKDYPLTWTNVPTTSPEGGTVPSDVWNLTFDGNLPAASQAALKLRTLQEYEQDSGTASTPVVTFRTDAAPGLARVTWSMTQFEPAWYNSQQVAQDVQVELSEPVLDLASLRWEANSIRIQAESEGTYQVTYQVVDARTVKLHFERPAGQTRGLPRMDLPWTITLRKGIEFASGAVLAQDDVLELIPEDYVSTYSPSTIPARPEGGCASASVGLSGLMLAAALLGGRRLRQRTHRTVRAG